MERDWGAGRWKKKKKEEDNNIFNLHCVPGGNNSIISVAGYKDRARAAAEFIKEPAPPSLNVHLISSGGATYTQPTLPYRCIA